MCVGRPRPRHTHTGWSYGLTRARLPACTRLTLGLADERRSEGLVLLGHVAALVAPARTPALRHLCLDASHNYVSSGGNTAITESIPINFQAPTYRWDIGGCVIFT